MQVTGERLQRGISYYHSPSRIDGGVAEYSWHTIEEATARLADHREKAQELQLPGYATCHCRRLLRWSPNIPIAVPMALITTAGSMM